MVLHDKEVFKDTRVVLDGGHFVNCMFTNCEIVYGGGQMGFEKNLLSGCRFSFDEAAARTVEFMKGMYKDAPELIEATFRHIRGA
jgi:hypothetical protein